MTDRMSSRLPSLSLGAVPLIVSCLAAWSAMRLALSTQASQKLRLAGCVACGDGPGTALDWPAIRARIMRRLRKGRPFVPDEQGAGVSGRSGARMALALAVGAAVPALRHARWPGAICAPDDMESSRARIGLAQGAGPYNGRACAKTCAKIGPAENPVSRRGQAQATGRPKPAHRPPPRCRGRAENAGYAGDLPEVLVSA